MEPIFTKPDLPRYTQRPFPSYRYLPYQSGATLPHPHNDPAGHSYHAEEEYLPPFTPEDWRSCELYLYGIDLFNHGYWWEAHEALEDVWLAAGLRPLRAGADPARRGAAQAFHGRTARGGVADDCRS